MRTVAFGLIFGLCVVVAAWTGFWLFAVHTADRRIDAWLADEAAQGRLWTCPNRYSGGYPFAMTVGCTRPTFTGRALGQTVKAEAAGLEAGASLAHPQSVTVTLDAPFSYRTSDGKADLTAKWSSLTIRVADQALDLAAQDVAVDGTFGDAGRQGGGAATLDSHFVSDGAEDPTIDFKIAVRGAPAPQIDALVGGGTVPVDVDLVGKLDHANVAQARTPADALERWRRAGGRLTLADSRIARDSASVTGSGVLGLDDAHRGQGRIDASFVGLEPILQRYGISGDLAAAGSLLNSLFGGGKPQAPSKPGALDLPISLQNGRLGIGPIRTQIAVPPLY